MSAPGWPEMSAPENSKNLQKQNSIGGVSTEDLSTPRRSEAPVLENSDKSKKCDFIHSLQTWPPPVLLKWPPEKPADLYGDVWLACGLLIGLCLACAWTLFSPCLKLALWVILGLHWPTLGLTLRPSLVQTSRVNETQSHTARS